MRLASSAACAAAALRSAGAPLCASCDPKGLRAAGGPWPRCRAQSAAPSRSRSTGETRPAADSLPHSRGRWSVAPRLLRGVGVGLRTTPAGSLGVSRRRTPRPGGARSPQAAVVGPLSAVARKLSSVLLVALGHQRLFPEPPPQPRLARAALGVDRWPGRVVRRARG